MAEDKTKLCESCRGTGLEDCSPQFAGDRPGAFKLEAELYRITKDHPELVTQDLPGIVVRPSERRPRTWLESQVGARS